MEKIEQIALKAMEKSNFKNESFEDFNNQISKQELNFDLELAEYERLDVEAQTFAPIFHVK